MSLLDEPLFTGRYFFPREEAPPEIVAVPVDGAVLACAQLRRHDGPLLLHFHGNGEVVADYIPDFAEAFSAVGIDTFFVEYRGYGASTGTPALVGMLADVERVLDFVGAPLDRVFVYGRSVGSIYAIHAVHRRPAIAGLIIESGIADLVERVMMRLRPGELGTRADIEREVREHLDHERKLRSYGGPVLVMHAEADSMVDVSHARRNASWAPRATLDLMGGDHNTMLSLNFATIVERVARFITTRTS